MSYREETKETGKKAVIYCRVSSVKQTKVGDGLDSQKTRCEEFARARGYTVAATFEDDRSGSLVDRPGMKALLAFLKKNRAAAPVVIIDDISRLARGVKAHIELRAAIALAGGDLQSPSVEFGDDADSELQEFLLASVAQHQRRKNSEQTRNRMRARMMNGYWPFACPIGYRYGRVPGHNGKVMVRDEPVASILQEALEGFASGRFQTQAEVWRFLESCPEYPRARNGKVQFQRVPELLTRAVYAGYVEAPDWGVSLRKGHQAPLISFETYQRIQERLKESARVPARKDIKADFPLRGAVACGCCGAPLTGYWAKGRNGHYPYYHCHKRDCEAYGKAIRRDKLEGEFEALLKRMQPTEKLIGAARAMFGDLWSHRLAASEIRARGLKGELAKIERQVEQLLDRITATDVASVIGAYEAKIKKLEEEKIVVSERIKNCGRPLKSFDETLRTALDFLASPWNLWASGQLENRRAVLKLAFADRLVYVRNEGLRTPNLSLPFKALAEFSGAKNGMVAKGGIEPPTHGFSVRCSTN
jgi:site-specific DNA recombinase